MDFTLSNARRFYSSMGNPLDGKGLTLSSLRERYCILAFHQLVLLIYGVHVLRKGVKINAI